MFIMAFTNSGLAEQAKKALSEGWHYGWGDFGRKATAANISALVSLYPSINAQWKNYMSQAIGKTRLCDCYGIVKSYLWWQGDDKDPKYNAAQDRNTNMAYDAAKEKGTLSNMPEIPGLILYKPGHVGVYTGSGEFIELRGDGTGAVKGTVKNGVITSGSKFTHWFKDTFITYEAVQPAVTPESVVNRLVAAGITSDGPYWLNVLQGKEAAKNEWLMILFDRLLKKAGI